MKIFGKKRREPTQEEIMAQFIMEADFAEKSFEECNELYNKFYNKFKACKRGWFWGAIVGIVLGALLALLISGGAINRSFFFALAFSGPAGILCCASFFGLQFTADFGFGWVAKGIMLIGLSGCAFFAGTYVLLPVALILAGLAFFGYVMALFVFAFLFPIETLYFRARYNKQKKYVRRRMKAAREAREKAPVQTEPESENAVN